MRTVKIGKEEISLLFDMDAFADMEEQVGTLTKLNDLLNGKSRVRNIVKMIVILGNAALVADGKEPTLTDKGISRKMEPRLLAEYQRAVMGALTDGMTSETEEEAKENEDEVLTEVKKKEAPAG